MQLQVDSLIINNISEYYELLESDNLIDVGPLAVRSIIVMVVMFLQVVSLEVVLHYLN